MDTPDFERNPGGIRAYAIRSEFPPDSPEFACEAILLFLVRRKNFTYSNPANPKAGIAIQQEPGLSELTAATWSPAWRELRDGEQPLVVFEKTDETQRHFDVLKLDPTRIFADDRAFVSQRVRDALEDVVANEEFIGG